jgi:hypothetical protein
MSDVTLAQPPVRHEALIPTFRESRAPARTERLTNNPGVPDPAF